MTKIYFTSSRQTFETRRYNYMLALAQVLWGEGDTNEIIVTRQRYRSKEAWQAAFPALLAGCDILVFFQDDKGFVGKGVFTEIQEALILNKDVFLLTDEGLAFAYNHENLTLAYRDTSNWTEYARFEVKITAHSQAAIGPSTLAGLRDQWLSSPRISVETPIWRTKDGRRVEVTAMTDGHLLNTATMLERGPIVEATKLFEALDDTTGRPHKELSKNFVEEANKVLLYTPAVGLLRYMVYVPAYQTMLREIARRGLKRVRRTARVGMAGDYSGYYNAWAEDATWD